MYTMKFFLMLVFVLCLSCSNHKSDKISSPENEVILALNSGNIELALNIIENEERRSGELSEKWLYWKAQALSTRANIDVYSLFPIVKMKLFEVAINEWDDVNKYSDKQRSVLNSTVFGDGTNPDRQKFLEKEAKRIKEISSEEIEYEIVSEIQYTDSYSNGEAFCAGIVIIESNIFLDGRQYEEYRSANFKLQNDYQEELEKICRKNLEGPYSNRDIGIKWIRDIALKMIEKKLKDIQERKDSERYIKAAFALYESVPVIQKVPDLSKTNLDDLDQAFKILRKLAKKNNQTREVLNAKKQLGLLSAFLILSSLKDSIHIDLIKDPSDLLCYAIPDKLVSNYQNLLKGIKFLTESTKGTEFESKNNDKFQKLLDAIKELPNELNEDQKARTIYIIESTIKESC